MFALGAKEDPDWEGRQNWLGPAGATLEDKTSLGGKTEVSRLWLELYKVSIT